jgi:hypothetical protein
VTVSERWSLRRITPLSTRQFLEKIWHRVRRKLTP